MVTAEVTDEQAGPFPRVQELQGLSCGNVWRYHNETEVARLLPRAGAGVHGPYVSAGAVLMAGDRIVAAAYLRAPGGGGIDGAAGSSCLSSGGRDRPAVSGSVRGGRARRRSGGQCAGFGM
ncbi:hypothetical protein GCM10027440_55300 [Nocardiopsis coralliicola]